MPWFDLPSDQLRQYRTDTAEPPELDRWWQLRLDEARAAARKPTLTRHEADIYAPVEVYDTEFSGAGGDRIRAWYLRPAGADGQTPVVVKFIGYGLARRITARCLLSVGLMDTICPPSTVFAAYNEISAGKDISVHPFTGHAVPAAHVERQIRHLRDFLR